MMKIKEIIVVEGRDDTNAIKKSVDAITIETHGYGITKATWELIDKAYHEKGIIVFTDPDHAGEQIRRRVLKKFPDAKEAFLDRKSASKNGDIGIENADAESICEALRKARCSTEEAGDVFDMDDMIRAGLVGNDDSSQRRKDVGRLLGIGYGNGKIFLQRLNKFGITKEEFNETIRTIDNTGNKSKA